MLRCSAHSLSIARKSNGFELVSGNCNRQLAYCVVLGSNEFVRNIVLASRHIKTNDASFFQCSYFNRVGKLIVPSCDRRCRPLALKLRG